MRRWRRWFQRWFTIGHFSVVGHVHIVHVFHRDLRLTLFHFRLFVVGVLVRVVAVVLLVAALAVGLFLGFGVLIAVFVLVLILLIRVIAQLIAIAQIFDDLARKP